MTAHRFIDNHAELTNVGQLTHSHIDAFLTGSSFLLLSDIASGPPLARRLVLGTGLTFVDNGPGSTLVLSLLSGSIAEGSTSSDLVTGLDTGALSDGDFVYVDDNDSVTKTDAANFASSRVIGMSQGAVGEIRTAGAFDNAKFSTASSTPTPGSPVFLARADDESLSAAAGKLTAIRPNSGFAVEVGTVLSVNAGTFGATRRAKIIFSPKTPTKLATV